jgi:hypothetical protein
MTRLRQGASARQARECGDCSLCCRLLPVPPLEKGANQRCQHQRHTGCRVYHKAGMPPECALWNCRWLVNDDTADLSRPDRSHIVIDIMPDFVTMTDHAGVATQIEVIQCWVDPRHPDAHKDPKFRAYVFRQAQRGKAALIRFSAHDAFTLFAPPFDKDGEWHEIRGDNVPTHSFGEVIEALS